MPSSKRNLLLLFVLLAFLGLVNLVFLGSLTGAFALFLVFGPRHRGVAIGELDLLDPGASFVADAQPGDTLFVPVDARVGLPSVDRLTQSDVDKKVSMMLGQSRFTVRALAPSGAERVLTCPVFNGNSSSLENRFSRKPTPRPPENPVSRAGMFNECSIPIDAAGRWTVRASVVWDPGLSVHEASLRVRREAAGQGDQDRG